MSLWRDLQTLVALRQLVLREQPDMVFAYTIKPVIYGSLAARAARVPSIFSMITGAGFAFLGESWKHRLAGAVARPLYRQALRTNRRVFFHNPDDRDLFLQLRLLRSADQAVVLAGSGVDLAEFPMCPPVVEPPVFMMAARFYREKGVREFVEAARLLRQRHPQVIVRLVGAPDSNPTAIPATEVERWKQEGVVEVVGWVEDIRPELSRCSVFVLPSYREGTPRSVLEAMAMGRPIITTDAPGCRETVVSGDNGFLVPVKDAQKLAAAMERFVVDPALVPSMGLRSRALTESKFDVRRVNEVMLEAMQIHRTA